MKGNIVNFITESIYHVCMRDSIGFIIYIDGSACYSLKEAREEIKSRSELNPNIEYKIVKKTVTKTLLK